MLSSLSTSDTLPLKDGIDISFLFLFLLAAIGFLEVSFFVESPSVFFFSTELRSAKFALLVLISTSKPPSAFGFGALFIGGRLLESSESLSLANPPPPPKFLGPEEGPPTLLFRLGR